MPPVQAASLVGLVVCDGPAWPMASGFEGLFAGEKPIDAACEIGQVGRVSTVHFCRDESAVLHFGQRAAHLRPVDVPLADVLPRELSVLAIEVEVLEVD